MEQTVALWQILEARGRRAARQRELLAQYRRPLVWFTMNIAGPVKTSPLICRGFEAGCAALLEREGIRRDEHLDYICAMLDESFQVIATGNCFGNTLRCFAVSGSHQGERLLNQIVTHLMAVQLVRGNTRLFLYMKISTAPFFSDLGFYEIARVDNTLVFMENRRNGFADYLKALSRHKGKRSAAIVMNANPFTLGRQYLVEKAAAEWNTVHLFLVSEDASLVPFSVRRQLAQAGVSHLPNAGIECRVVPRLEIEGGPVSASTVRDEDWASLRRLVPPATYDYFTGAECAPVLKRIRRAPEVAHY